MGEKKEIGVKDLLSPTVIFIIICACYASLGLAVPPFNRGFFCDDKTIQKPYVTKQTVPNTIALITGVSLVVVSIIMLESINFFRTPKNVQCSLDDNVVVLLGCLKTRGWIVRMIARIFAFGFGALLNALVTEITKLMIGRLRPHFLAACKPNYDLFNCTQGFINIADVCTGTKKMVTEARKSFPSGHSSFSAFTMVFLALYIEYTWPSRRHGFVKSFTQLVVLLLALACGLSRVSDYFHHWSDVFAGFALGVTFAFYTIHRFMNLPKEEKAVRMQRTLYEPPDIESRQSSALSGNEMENCVNHKQNEVYAE